MVTWTRNSNDSANARHEGIEFLRYPYDLPVHITFEVALDGLDSDGAFFWGDFTGGPPLVADESGR